MKLTENATIKTAEMTFALLSTQADIDIYEALRFEAQEKSLGTLKLLRQQYSTIQSGTTKTAQPGELPFTIAKDAIKRLWDSKSRSETAKYENFHDMQMKKLKSLIETGEFYTRKKESVEEKIFVAIDKLEKKLAADKAKAEKIAQDAEKAIIKADKAAQALAVKDAKAAQVVVDIVQGKQIKLDQINAVETDLQVATTEKQDIDAVAASTLNALAQAKQSVLETEREITKLKEKKDKLSAPKAASTKSDPKLDFKTTNFSKDCKDTAQALLVDLEKDCSNAELLYLAKLILDKYNK